MAGPEELKGIIPPPTVSPVRPQGIPVQIPPAGSPGFRDVLRDVTATQAPASGQPLTFSGHALKRLESRGIQLSPDDMSKMNAMADKAAAKGAQQSLFMLRDTAMVVSIKNRVVITAVDKDSMRENVFTNIDSAAIVG